MTRDNQDQAIIDGMWTIIDSLHHTMTTTAKSMEWYFDVTPPEHKAQAAKLMDKFNAMMESGDELVGPIRKIMEGKQ